MLQATYEDDALKPKGRVEAVVRPQYHTSMYEYMSFHADNRERDKIWDFITKLAALG